MAIDNALRNVGLQRIVNYPYIVGDCLFDSISYLLHGIVCSISLRKGSIEYLWHALVTNDYRVEHYLKPSFNPDFFMSLHGVDSVENYLDGLECEASNGGLWADFTIFFWLSEFIKCPMEAWSIRTCRPYMNVGDIQYEWEVNFGISWGYERSLWISKKTWNIQFIFEQ